MRPEQSDLHSGDPIVLVILVAVVLIATGIRAVYDKFKGNDDGKNS